MAHVYVSAVIPVSIDRLWPKVRDFNGLPNWHPLIASSRIEEARDAAEVGCIRNFELHDGSVIREQLLSLSDQDHACTYAILESHMGVENYTATFRLSPVTEDDTSFAEWWADFECAADEEKDLEEMIGTSVFAAGMRALGDWR